MSKVTTVEFLSLLCLSWEILLIVEFTLKSAELKVRYPGTLTSVRTALIDLSMAPGQNKSYVVESRKSADVYFKNQWAEQKFFTGTWYLAIWNLEFWFPTLIKISPKCCCYWRWCDRTIGALSATNLTFKIISRVVQHERPLSPLKIQSIHPPGSINVLRRFNQYLHVRLSYISYTAEICRDAPNNQRTLYHQIGK